MPKVKRLTATEREAESSLSPHARQHAEYVRTVHGVHDAEGGVMDGHHMRKIAPVRPLEGWARKNPKAKEPYLDAIHILAANKYHDLIEAAHGRMNHEIKEQVDSSPNPEGRTLGFIEANDILTRIHVRMPMDFKSMADLIFVKFPDKSAAQIWPNRTLRNISREIAKDMLIWLAAEFGLTSDGR